MEGTAPNFTYRSPTKKITLRMLLTSGLSYAVSTKKLWAITMLQGDVRQFCNANTRDLLKVKFPGITDLSGILEFHKVPLVFEPGESWHYSSGLYYILVDRLV